MEDACKSRPLSGNASFESRPKSALSSDEWHLPSRFISELLKECSYIEYEKGATLFVSGAPSDILILVQVGIVRVYATDLGGRERTFMLAGTGDILGFATARDARGPVHRLSAVALTRCSVSLFTRRHLFQLLSTLTPSQLLRLIEDLNARWSKALLWYVRFLRLTLRQRLLLLLHELGAKFGRDTATGLTLDIKLGSGEIADFVGCSRPIVARLLDQLVSMGAIQFDDAGKIILVNGYAPSASQ
jgi:CRP-like cAMP-binding protein